jgi:predicted ABC-type ATPase
MWGRQRHLIRCSLVAACKESITVCTMSDSDTKSPTVHVVAGVNGSGKTTFATKFLPEFANCREFLNADLIASGLSPFLPEEQNMRAGRLLLSRIRELAFVKKSFGFETTLSGRTYLHLFSKMKSDGYRITLFFLWLNNCDVAISRVANRVRQGGHRVPETDIRRRFPAGIYNFFHLYRPLLDEWRLFDASELPPRVVASEKNGKLDVLVPDLFMQIKSSAKAAEL